MKRYQSARPLSSILGESFGFLGRRHRRRRTRPRAERQLEKRISDEEPASLVRLPQRTPAQTSGWGPLTRLGEQLRIQARRGYRAAVVELKPGMYLVAEIPEATLQPGIGVIPLLAPLIAMAAQKALRSRGRRRQREPEPIVEDPPPQIVEDVPARWMDVEDIDRFVEAGNRGRS